MQRVFLCVICAVITFTVQAAVNGNPDNNISQQI